MATGGAAPTSNPEAIPPHASHRGAPAPHQPASAPAPSPPSKRELASWWRKFSKKPTERPDERTEAPGIFGVPLAESIRYANVAISLTDDHGDSFIYGYVPIVVAKCGVFLKEKATDVEGIFRLSGSAKRIKDLQAVFNSPDRYGKGLDWTGYTVHDAANILRRYLNQLPEPIVPLESYERFRDPLRPYAARAVSDGDAVSIDLSVEQHSQAVTAYQKLITELPPLNRQLLLYILDLLAVFASKSDLNRMNAANLAAIFQPGTISHPQHDMAPTEYRLSQDVLIFLIENQDNFLIGMSGTAVDEKTVKDVESGTASNRSPKPSSAVGRSASNASAGADSLRKYGVRRNVSVSSGHSRERGSPGVSSPGTPTGLSQLSTAVSNTGGIGRSNTVPSKRSPALAGARFQRKHESSTSNSPVVGSSGSQVEAPLTPLPPPEAPPPGTQPPRSPNIGSAPVPSQSPSLGPSQPAGGSKERKISNLFSRSPLFSPAETQQVQQTQQAQQAQTLRQPKKLQKRPRIPGSVNESAQSSQASLQGDDTSTFHTPLVSPSMSQFNRPDPIATAAQPNIQNTSATPVETPTVASMPPGSAEKPQSSHLQPGRSPPTSIHSRSSVTDHSEFDTLDNAVPAAANAAASPPEKEKRRSRWRFSSSAKRTDDFPLSPPPPIGSNAGARGSNSSFGSSRPRKSFTGDTGATGTAPHDGEGSMQGGQTIMGASTHSRESSEMLRDVTNTNTNSSNEEKKGLFGKWKAKMSERSEQKKLEKERAKSPSAPGQGQQSRTSLSSTVASATNQGPRGRSIDASRGGSQSSTEGGIVPVEAERSAPTLETVTERPQTEARERADMSGLPSSSEQAAAPPVPPIVPQHEMEKKQPSDATALEAAVEPPSVAASTAPMPVPVASNVVPADVTDGSGNRPSQPQQQQQQQGNATADPTPNSG